MINEHVRIKRKITHICMAGMLAITMLFSSDLYDMTDGSVLKAESKVNIGKKKLHMYEGQTVKLRNKKYTWKTSNKKVVTVNKKGKLKAKKAGTAKVTASKKIGKKKKKAVCKIYVGKYAKDISITSAQTVVLKKGQISTIRAEVTPNKVLYKDLIFSSDNTGIVTVDANGIITPVAQGNATITIASKAVAKNKKAILKKITVVVMADIVEETKAPEPTPKNNLFDDIEEGGFTVVTPTPKPSDKPLATPTATSVPPTKEPTVTDDPGSTEKPVATVTPTAEPTERPTQTPVPTPGPTTIAEYIGTLTPDPNHPFVGSFTITNTQGTVRTIYLLNKQYSGNMALQIGSYTYSEKGSVTSVLKTLENDRMSVKNGAGTIHVYRKKLEDSWTVHFLKENIIYSFSAKVEDTNWGSPYGIIVADGDTTDVIKILTN